MARIPLKLRGDGDDDISMKAAQTQRAVSKDGGFTLIEILIVIVILGVLATVTVFAVQGISDKGEEASCQSDHSIITKAAEYYMANHNVDEIPASGVDDDRYERTLVEDSLLRNVSSYHDLAADGAITTTGEPCP